MTEEFLRTWLKVVVGNEGTERICRNCQNCMNLYTKFANYMELPIGICVENKDKENTGTLNDIIIDSLKPACEKFKMRKQKSNKSEEEVLESDVVKQVENEDENN